MDNGELISKASNVINSELGITVKNEPAWRPDLKGIVESRFHLLNISTKAALPGAVLPDFAQRGAPDYRLDAKLTLTEFTQIVIHFILNHNGRLLERHPQPLPDVLADHVPPIPLELWKWGIHNRSGSLRKMEPEALRVALAQRDRAQVTAKGIKFHNLYYQCETAEAENWFSKARIKGGWKVEIAYHPRDMEKVYWLKGPQEYEDCVRTIDSIMLYPGESLEEILWLRGRQMAQKAAYSDVSLQSEVDSSRAVDEIIQRAGQAAKTIPLEAARMKAKPREIRKNRKVEAEKLRAEKRTGRAELSKAPPEVSSKPRSMSGLDAQFWQFAEEEEDD
ncbi:Transposon Tn7 transposition protein TnsB [bioreactor metagenome]|uniref:Transposon Tn7 transposition protein TnsB n=1 Tax=bioreactor metagenome TaxID=1076179 RepID=A0A645BJ45_9ZZZZ